MSRSINCTSIYTREVDEPQAALAELTQQLTEKMTLAAHTVGILQCHPEFVASGVFAYVAARLPFEVVGTTTSSQAVNGMVDEMLLTVFVMTADDAHFHVGKTTCLEGDLEAPLAAALETAAPDAKLVLLFPPLALTHPGDSHVEAWNKNLPGVPVFGAFPTDDSVDFAEARTLFRDEAHQTVATFVLCYGNIQPRFLISTLPSESALSYQGEITKSEGNVVHEIDGQNAATYLCDMGFAQDKDALNAHWFVPFAISQKERPDFDGVPILRAFANISEEGSGIFRGKIDQGSVFTILDISNEFVLAASGKTAAQIPRLPQVNGVLAFSCVVRRMALMISGSCYELSLVQRTLGDIPFMLGYAGGEICPTSVRNHAATNRFHNFTLVILVL